MVEKQTVLLSDVFVVFFFVFCFFRENKDWHFM